MINVYAKYSRYKLEYTILVAGDCIIRKRIFDAYNQIMKFRNSLMECDNYIKFKIYGLDVSEYTT